MIARKHLRTGIRGVVAVNVNITNVNADIDVKRRGVEFRVRGNDGTFLGDFYVTEIGVEWCKGRVAQNKGEKMTWSDFIEFMESR